MYIVTLSIGNQEFYWKTVEIIHTPYLQQWMVLRQFVKGGIDLIGIIKHQLVEADYLICQGTQKGNTSIVLCFYFLLYITSWCR